jgi:uncharacterized protein (TIGR03083 family)
MLGSWPGRHPAASVMRQDRGVRFLRVEVAGLLPQLRGELVALLASLPAPDWESATSCPGWSVHDVAAHLLGVDVGNVSARRDGWALGPGLDENLDAWLDEFNQQWVDAARRISPALLTELIDLAGRRFEGHVAELDLDAIGGPVEWATKDAPAPVWLDIAREYMERYVHQDQIRRACGRPPLGRRFTEPVLATAVHALPLALADVSRPAGTVVSFTADDGGHETAWYLIRTQGGWELGRTAPAEPAACELRTTTGGAIGSFVRDPAAPAFTWRGDPELANAVSQARAILGQ